LQLLLLRLAIAQRVSERVTVVPTSLVLLSHIPQPLDRLAMSNDVASLESELKEFKSQVKLLPFLSGHL
jgi:hypothetical protein